MELVFFLFACLGAIVFVLLIGFVLTETVDAYSDYKKFVEGTRTSLKQLDHMVDLNCIDIRDLKDRVRKVEV